jgi:hypothetical protein
MEPKTGSDDDRRRSLDALIDAYNALMKRVESLPADQDDEDEPTEFQQEKETNDE